MPRFEHSIAQLTQSLTTSNGWLEIAKSRLGISINDVDKWQGFVDKYQSEIDDMKSAIAHLKELSDNDMHIFARTRIRRDRYRIPGDTIYSRYVPECLGYVSIILKAVSVFDALETTWYRVCHPRQSLGLLTNWKLVIASQ